MCFILGDLLSHSDQFSDSTCPPGSPISAFITFQGRLSSTFFPIKCLNQFTSFFQFQYINQNIFSAFQKQTTMIYLSMRQKTLLEATLVDAQATDQSLTHSKVSPKTRQNLHQNQFKILKTLRYVKTRKIVMDVIKTGVWSSIVILNLLV